MTLKKLTTLSLFTTLSLIIFLLESLLPPLTPVPGIKLGLANIITLVLLRNYSLKDTALVLIARILLSAFFAGQAMSLIYSLAGGLASLMIMFLFNRLLNGHYIFLTSITGGIAHNLGQLFIAYLITRVPGVWMYLPFLIPGGMLTGLFTGLCAHFAQKYLMPVITRYLS